MRSDLGSSLRRLFPPRRSGDRGARGSGGQRGVQEVSPEFTTEELEDFLRADHLPVQADPDFKERLREELWDMVQAQSTPDRRDGSNRE